jgi:ribosomal protein S4
MGRPAPAWIEVNDTDFTARVARLPNRDDVTLDVEELLIVEFMSR